MQNYCKCIIANNHKFLVVNDKNEKENKIIRPTQPSQFVKKMPKRVINMTALQDTFNLAKENKNVNKPDD